MPKGSDWRASRTPSKRPLTCDGAPTAGHANLTGRQAFFVSQKILSINWVAEEIADQRPVLQVSAHVDRFSSAFECRGEQQMFKDHLPFLLPCITL